MAAIAEPVQSIPQTAQRPIVICHCTVVHKGLKSRSFHRQMLPLARVGFDIRYIAPAAQPELTTTIKMIGVSESRNSRLRLAAWPALLKNLLRQNAALYHVQDPQLLPLAFVLKLIFQKRVVYDAYEDFPSIAAAKYSIPPALRPLAASAIAVIECAAARVFDAIITADPTTMRRFARVGKSKKLVFYNFPNLRFFPVSRARSANFDLVYRGGISERTGMFVLLEALRLLVTRPLPPRLLLIGYFDDGPAENVFHRRVHTLGLDSVVEIRSRIDHESMAAALSGARIGISPLLAVPKFQKNIPVKIFEYWACGLPVVATDLDPIRPFFRDGEGGISIPPGDPEKLAQAIAWLLDDPESAKRMGNRGRQLVIQRFNNTGEVRKLRRLIERIVSPSEGGHFQPCSSLS